MNLKYKIVEVNSTSHSIVVRFYTDIITEESLATQTVNGVIARCRTDFSLDLPAPAPQGTALEAFIVAHAPQAWLQLQETILAGVVDTSLSALTSLVGVEIDIAPVAPSVPVAAIPVTVI